MSWQPSDSSSSSSSSSSRASFCDFKERCFGVYHPQHTLDGFNSHVHTSCEFRKQPRSTQPNSSGTAAAEQSLPGVVGLLSELLTRGVQCTSRDVTSKFFCSRETRPTFLCATSNRMALQTEVLLQYSSKFIK